MESAKYSSQNILLAGLTRKTRFIWRVGLASYLLHERAKCTTAKRKTLTASAMKEKQWNMNKCISPATLLRQGEEACFGRNDFSVCVRQLGDDGQNFVSRGEYTRKGRAEYRGPFDTRGIPGAAILQSSLKNTVGRNVALTRKSHPLQPWILMDLSLSLSPRGESFRPEQRRFALRNLRASIVPEMCAWLHSRKKMSSLLSRFSFSFLVYLSSSSQSRGPSRATELCIMQSRSRPKRASLRVKKSDKRVLNIICSWMQTHSRRE